MSDAEQKQPVKIVYVIGCPAWMSREELEKLVRDQEAKDREVIL